MEVADLAAKLGSNNAKRPDLEKIAGEVGNGSDAKRPREGNHDHRAIEMEEEEEEDSGPYNPFADDANYRKDWNMMYGKNGAKFEDPTTIPPMRNTDGPVLPLFADRMDTMEIFFVKVTQLTGSLQWPLDIYGDVAVRDSMDHKRNYLFCRSRDDCQTLTSAQDSCLELSGPSRAVLLWDNPAFEIDLKVNCHGSPSEDKILCCRFFGYNNLFYRGDVSYAKSQVISSENSTVEVKFAHVTYSVEATITARLISGSGKFSARLTAKTMCIGEDVVLLDTRGREVSIGKDSMVLLQRQVVVVEEHGKLILGIEGAQLDAAADESSIPGAKEFVFPARSALRSEGFLSVGSSRLHMMVAWSLLP